MKSSRFAIGLVGLALVGLWYFAGGTTPLPASRAAETQQRVTAPITHENLTVYFVHGPDALTDVKVMSLQEALERDLAVVHETSNVNTLAIENRSSEYELFVQSGDIVKGGKQDRMVQFDMLLPPKSGVVPLAAHCVEQGRWTGRGSEDAKQFASSYKCAAGKELKYANASGVQAEVWAKVKRNQERLNDNLKANVNAEASPTSFQLTLESAALEAKVAAYEAALKAAGDNRSNVIGVVFVVNGQVSGAEVYGSNALFRKAWPKLLNSAAVEAVADQTDAPAAPPPSAREIEKFLAYGATAEPTGAGASGALVSSDEPAAIQLDALRRSRQRGVAIDNEELPGEALQTEGQRAARPAAVQVYRPQLANPAGATNDNVIMGGSGAGRVTPQPVINSDGNRLSSSRTENNSTLTVESRDASRANAVIHRSILPRDVGTSAPAQPARPAPAQPLPTPPAMPRP